MSKHITDAYNTAEVMRNEMQVGAAKIKQEIEKLEDPDAKRSALDRWQQAKVKIDMVVDNSKAVCREFQGIQNLVDNYKEMQEKMP